MDDKFPLPPKVPPLPGFDGFTRDNLPDDERSLKTAIRGRLEAEADLSRFMVKNRGILTQLKRY